MFTLNITVLANKFKKNVNQIFIFLPAWKIKFVTTVLFIGLSDNSCLLLIEQNTF